MWIWQLWACTNGGSESEPATIKESTDSVGDVPVGPDCTENDWPISTPFNQLAARLVEGRATPDQLEELDILIDDYAVNNLGPWRHQVWGPQHSSDGLHFSGDNGIRLENASVPELVIAPDGKIWIFYVDGDLEELRTKAASGEAVGPGLRGFGGLTAAISEDGISFVPMEIEISGALPAYIVDPDIIRTAEGSWQLYYLGVPAERLCADTPDPFASAAPHSMYLATSDDLVHWVSQGEVWSVEGPGTDPAVWCTEEPACYLYMGSPARSTDGGLSFSPFAMDLPYTPMLPDAVVRGGQTFLYHKDPSQLRLLLSGDQKRWEDGGLVEIEATGATVAMVGDETWMYLLSSE